MLYVHLRNVLITNIIIHLISNAIIWYSNPEPCSSTALMTQLDNSTDEVVF